MSVARHGHLAYSKSFGQMDRERGKPTADDTIFRIYSMTKPITSVALMTLYEQGYFQLNDPVSRYVPSWKNHRVWVSGEGETMKTEAPARPVTFRDVLSHTAGFTYGGGLPGVGIQHPIDKVYRELKVRSVGGADTMQEFLDKLGQVPLRYQPGTAWMYSLATDVCGALVEVISGKPFAAVPAGGDLRAAGHEGHRLLRGAGQGRPLRRQLSARARQEAEADRRPGDQRLHQGARLQVRRRRADRHHRRLLALLRDAAARRRAGRRARSWGRAPSS